MNKKVFLTKIIFVIFILVFRNFAKPKLTVVLVIDQFAAHYLPKLDGYLGYGINHLLKNGIVYTNAFYPHGALETAVGHTSLGTGTIPGYHGIVANDWLDEKNVEHALTFDTADEIVVAPFTKAFLAANSHNKAVAISLKDRAAIGMVGASAPIIWLDQDRGVLATNKPNRVTSEILVATNASIAKPRQTHWDLAYKDERYYQFPFVDNYDYASEKSLFLPESHVGTAISREMFIKVFFKLPEANQLLLDCARSYIERTIGELGTDGSLLVWISLSPLDKIGHIYGPFSREVIDMIYHLDKQIGLFMTNLAKVVSPRDTCYVLTADHGVMPIPELVKPLYPQAQRIVMGDIISEVNQYIKKQFKITKIIRGQKVPHVYLNQKQLKKCSPKKQRAVIDAVQSKLSEYPGISVVYEAQKLLQAQVPVGSIAWLFKNNIYPGRSGDLLLQIAPYTIASKYTGGTKHYTPYAYNTHVPLMLYQQGALERKVITQHVWTNQVTATLAQILEILPTRYMLKPLPGVMEGMAKLSDSRTQTDLYQPGTNRGPIVPV